MEIFITVLVTFIAGAGAGLGTGFAGMIAAVVIAPLLHTFLGVDAYMAIGIALASDVLASAVSSITYGIHKNLDIKHGLLMLVSVLLFTVLGSFLGSLLPSVALGGASTFMTILLGIKFVVKPVTTTKEGMLSVSKKKRIVGSLVCGALIGLVCGFVGAGGGIMMLIILTMVLGYELKTAVGTSVFIMTFTALAGSVSHFVIAGAPDWLIFGLAVGFTFIWAQIASVIANRAKPKTLNTVLGIILIVIGAVVLVFNIINWVTPA